MRLTWLTDLHLEFLTPARLTQFCVGLARAAPESLLITGDISQSRGLEKHLRILERTLECPIYFVLGNHDFYYGSIGEVRALAERVSLASPRLCWLPSRGIIPLSEATALVGHDGWADGRFGDYARSAVMLNDYRFIQEFVGLGRDARLARLGQLGDEAAAYLRGILPEALSRWRRVIVATHVPPFAQAAWHEGRISDDDWLPHFSCKVVGEVLVEAMRERPDREMLVLCGHTHGAGEIEVLPNLKVVTGGAVYGEPRVQRVLTIE